MWRRCGARSNKRRNKPLALRDRMSFLPRKGWYAVGAAPASGTRLCGRSPAAVLSASGGIGGMSFQCPYFCSKATTPTLVKPLFFGHTEHYRALQKITVSCVAPSLQKISAPHFARRRPCFSDAPVYLTDKPNAFKDKRAKRAAPQLSVLDRQCLSAAARLCQSLPNCCAVVDV